MVSEYHKREARNVLIDAMEGCLDKVRDLILCTDGHSAGTDLELHMADAALAVVLAVESGHDARDDDEADDGPKDEPEGSE